MITGASRTARPSRRSQLESDRRAGLPPARCFHHAALPLNVSETDFSSTSGAAVQGTSTAFVGGVFQGLTGVSATGTSVYGVFAQTSSNSGNAAIHGEVVGSNF